MNLLGYSPHLFAGLLFIFSLEFFFYEKRIGGIRMTGAVLRLALLMVVGLMIVYFMSSLYGRQFHHHKIPPVIRPSPIERLTEV